MHMLVEHHFSLNDAETKGTVIGLSIDRRYRFFDNQTRAVVAVAHIDHRRTNAEKEMLRSRVAGIDLDLDLPVGPFFARPLDVHHPDIGVVGIAKIKSELSLRFSPNLHGFRFHTYLHFVKGKVVFNTISVHEKTRSPILYVTNVHLCERT